MATRFLTSRRCFTRRLGRDAAKFMYVRRDRNVASHLFRVAAGLESMVLGEAQIHGQVREAWEECRAESGPMLNRLFQTALLAASRAREETGIGKGAAPSARPPCSSRRRSLAAWPDGARWFSARARWPRSRWSGCMNEGVRVAIVANRTYERALALAERHGATAMHYDECWQSLADVDVLLCSTASPRAGRDA